MLLDCQTKLSRIFDHNYDKLTDRLYQPLRTAVQALPTPTSNNSLDQMPIGQMKCSRINISRAEQNIIKNSILIPINKKLVETNNPEKRIRARSRSYRALSVEQRIGSPMTPEIFKESLNKAGQKVEIVYDYDIGSNPNKAASHHFTEYYGPVTTSTMARTRSATYVGGVWESLMSGERQEKAQTRVQRKPSNHSSTSIQLRQSKNPTKLASEPNNGGEYYQNCKRYQFKTDIKRKVQKESVRSSQRILIKNAMVSQSDYKYNLFNLLDQPVNTKCSNGLCHKNEIIAPRIKKRW